MDRFSLKDWLYRVAAELHDGPDAHLEQVVKDFADTHGVPDEPPSALAEVQDVPINPNPTPMVGQLHDLPLVTEPTPEPPADPNKLTPEEVAGLRAFIAKMG